MNNENRIPHLESSIQVRVVHMHAHYPFTLHIRLTHACNAMCTYCSAWQKDPAQRMNPEMMEKCLDGLEAYWERQGICPTYLNVEYVGGEVLLIPHRELEAIVSSVRRRFGNRMTVRDGAQSNLIGSPERIAELFALFENRVGTSIDNFTHQRQLGGKGTDKQRARRYRSFVLESTGKTLQIAGFQTPGVITIDAHNIACLEQEVEIAIRENRALVLRPVFQGGCSIEKVRPEALGSALSTCFEHWAGKGMPIHLEPFVSLLKRRLAPDEALPFCAWQRDCAMRSASVEPNGDLFVCQELADMGTLKLGNLITKEFNFSLHEKLARRVELLENGCFKCPYFNSCQGGCMQQSVEIDGNIYGKTQWCQAWKMLFKAMDDYIHAMGSTRVLNRVNWLFGERN